MQNQRTTDSGSAPTEPANTTTNNSNSSSGGHESLSSNTPPARSPLPASLTSPPPRSATMTPGPHYATAPALTAMRSKQPQQRGDAAVQQQNWLEISSSVSELMSCALSTSVEGNSLSLAATTTPPVSERTSARVMQRPLLPSPHPPATPSASATSPSTSAMVLIQQGPWRPPHARGDSVGAAPRRRAENSSGPSCNLPQLTSHPAPLPEGDGGGHIATADVAATAQSTRDGNGDEEGLADQPPWHSQTSPPDTAGPRFLADALQSVTSSPTPSAVSPFSVLQGLQLTQREGVSGPPLWAAAARRPPHHSPSSPPLLPRWVYAISEHIGSRLPSPTVRGDGATEGCGGEVASLRADAAEAPRRRRATSLHLSPLAVTTGSSRSISGGSHPSSVPPPLPPPLSQQLYSLSGNDILGLEAHPTRDASPLPVETTSPDDALAGLRFLMSYPPQSHHTQHRDESAETETTQPALPAFFTPPRVADIGWRLERAVQPLPNTAEATEKERSRASLYAADRMSKSDSTTSLPPT